MGSIAIFDSGVGGLTFLKQARQCLPKENFIYYADSDHAPYGIRSTEEVRQLVVDAMEFLYLRDIKIVVLACNSATSAAGGELRTRYDFPVIGMEPALKPALAAAGTRKVLLLSTSLTQRENKLKKLMADLDADHRVDAIPFDDLVLSAERLEFDTEGVRTMIHDKFSALHLDEYGAIVLGCTHFIFYHHLFEQILPPPIRVFDGNLGTLNHLRRIMADHGLAATGQGGHISFFSSGKATEAQRAAKFMALLAPS